MNKFIGVLAFILGIPLIIMFFWVTPKEAFNYWLDHWKSKEPWGVFG